ncbi:LAFE_0E02058g1_1 [Lachancea fermentati]|uniref:LAFE_0E02058g1_1 n=1 Tax=Lachancea fermentati TaxID=4955 RepID=A0A1G4MCF7_LACFM|nr:LAFE_0E02058g1_1 [Lachancea fermentati]
MPLLTAKHYEEGRHIQQTVDEFNPYNLQNYTIRDDDEITSSDEYDEEENEDPNSQSWLESGARATTASQVDDGESGKIRRPRSASPFKKSLSSLFKRSSGSDEETHEKREPSREPESSKEPDTVLSFISKEDSSDTISNSTRFWRSWKHRNHKHDEEKRSKITPKSKEGSNSETTPTCTDVSLTRRGSNMAKLLDLELQVEEDDLENIKVNKASEKDLGPNISDSTTAETPETKKELDYIEPCEPSSSLREFCDGFENNTDLASDEVRMPSPLTPVDDVVVWKKDKLSFGAEQYRHVFQNSNAYAAGLTKFDEMKVDRRSKTYANFSIVLQLLEGTKDEISDLRSLLELSDDILVLARRISRKASKLSDENSQFELRLKTLTKYQKEDPNAYEIEQKNAKINELELELSNTKEKYETSLEDLYSSRKELKATREELIQARHTVDDNEQLINTLRTDLQKEQTNLKSVEETCKNDLKLKADEADKNLTDFNNVKEELSSLTMKYKNLEFDHQLVKEQHESSRDRLCDLVHSLTEHESIERQLREKVTQLETNSVKSDNKISDLKRANGRIQQDYHRERRKVLDLRKDLKLLTSQLELIGCHKDEALQFMAQLMMSYRSILSADTMTECDTYLQSLNSNTLFNNMMFDPNTSLNEQLLKEQGEEERLRVITFYRQFAKVQLLDQVVAKHISYMRSNSFLSQQLRGLRKQLQDNEEYIARLLKDCKTQRTLISKQDEKIVQLKKVNSNHRSKDKGLNDRNIV